MCTFVFQSTPSTRRETCGSIENDGYTCISIHSLHTEGDHSYLPPVHIGGYFNPLPPHGGRHGRRSLSDLRYHISIHSLHTEGDRMFLKPYHRLCHFNPLPPHGGRQAPDGADRRLHRISIHSLHTEGDAFVHGTVIAVSGISIHSLHTEGDEVDGDSMEPDYLFQSTPSTRRETKAEKRLTLPKGISIHSLHTEGDFLRFLVRCGKVISIHSLHTEGDAYFLVKIKS